MSDVNIPAVASGAFLGFLALLCIVACVPPVTRFLGDLFCCPWRIPFTKKKRRNGDEEMEQSDFPYLNGKDEAERLDTPGRHEESHHMSAAYLSAVSLVDPATMKEEWRRSQEFLNMANPPIHEHPVHGQYPAGYHSNNEMTMHHNEYTSQHLQVPGQRTSQWRQPSPVNFSPERSNNHAPQHSDPYQHVEDYSPPEHYPGDHYGESYVDVQRPPPSHVHTPPEVNHNGPSHGYFPQSEWEQEEYHSGYSANNDRPHASSERLMGPPRQQYHNP